MAIASVEVTKRLKKSTGIINEEEEEEEANGGSQPRRRHHAPRNNKNSTRALENPLLPPPPPLLPRANLMLRPRDRRACLSLVNFGIGLLPFDVREARLGRGRALFYEGAARRQDDEVRLQVCESDVVDGAGEEGGDDRSIGAGEERK